MVVGVLEVWRPLDFFDAGNLVAESLVASYKGAALERLLGGD